MALNFKLVGQRIREVRKTRGLSMEELAEQVGLNKESLRHIETGVSKPRLQTLFEIANILDVSMDYLTGRLPALPDSVIQDYLLTAEQEKAVQEAFHKVISVFVSGV